MDGASGRRAGSLFDRRVRLLPDAGDFRRPRAVQVRFDNDRWRLHQAWSCKSSTNVAGRLRHSGYVKRVDASRESERVSKSTGCRVSVINSTSTRHRTARYLASVRLEFKHHVRTVDRRGCGDDQPLFRGPVLHRLDADDIGERVDGDRGEFRRRG